MVGGTWIGRWWSRKTPGRDRGRHAQGHRTYFVPALAINNRGGSINPGWHRILGEELARSTTQVPQNGIPLDVRTLRRPQKANHTVSVTHTSMLNRVIFHRNSFCHPRSLPNLCSTQPETTELLANIFEFTTRRRYISCLHMFKEPQLLLPVIHNKILANI